MAMKSFIFQLVSLSLLVGDGMSTGYRRQGPLQATTHCVVGGQLKTEVNESEKIEKPGTYLLSKPVGCSGNLISWHLCAFYNSNTTKHKIVFGVFRRTGPFHDVYSFTNGKEVTVHYNKSGHPLYCKNWTLSDHGHSFQVQAEDWPAVILPSCTSKDCPLLPALNESGYSVFYSPSQELHQVFAASDIDDKDHYVPQRINVQAYVDYSPSCCVSPSVYSEGVTTEPGYFGQPIDPTCCVDAAPTDANIVIPSHKPPILGKNDIIGTSVGVFFFLVIAVLLAVGCTVCLRRRQSRVEPAAPSESDSNSMALRSSNTNLSYQTFDSPRSISPFMEPVDPLLQSINNIETSDSHGETAESSRGEGSRRATPVTGGSDREDSPRRPYLHSTGFITAPTTVSEDPGSSSGNTHKATTSQSRAKAHSRQRRGYTSDTQDYRRHAHLQERRKSYTVGTGSNVNTKPKKRRMFLPPHPRQFSDSEESEDPYWTPASREDDLLKQLNMLQIAIISTNDLKIIDRIGSGHFGSVNRGVWHTPSEEMDVAVKSLPARSSEDERVKFLQEATTMGQFKHPNIIRILGVIITTDLLCIVTELAHKGDLHHYLRSLRPPSGSSAPPDLPAILLSFCRQVAAGMCYLSHKGFIHRDIAARNILLSLDHTCKIGDFGLARDLQEEEFYSSHGAKIPVKWTAPEVFSTRRYSTTSDMWSYGVLLYEIWGLGKKPYHTCDNTATLVKVETGYRMPPPPGCPRAIYKLMIECWHPNSVCRPKSVDALLLLQRPEFQLLHWCEADQAASTSEARELGSSKFDAAEALFKDLQETYTAHV